LTLANLGADYTSAVLGVMAVFTAINWFIHGNKLYHGPRLAEE
jgi:choline transport protein